MENPALPRTPVNRLEGPPGLPIVLHSPLSFHTPAHASNLLGLAWPNRVEVADQTARLALASTGLINGQLVKQLTPAKLFVLVDVTKLGTGAAADAFEQMLDTIQGDPGTAGAITVDAPSNGSLYARFNGGWAQTVAYASFAALGDTVSALSTNLNTLSTSTTTALAGKEAIGWTSKTATYTAVKGDKILAGTAGGAFTINLPATPAVGDPVAVAPLTTWTANNLTVAGNGHNIEGDSTLLCDTDCEIHFRYNGTQWKFFYLP